MGASAIQGRILSKRFKLKAKTDNYKFKMGALTASWARMRRGLFVAGGWLLEGLAGAGVLGVEAHGFGELPASGEQVALFRQDESEREVRLRQAGLELELQPA